MIMSPSVLRSNPLADRVAISEMGVPSIHSVVSTCLAVRCQSTLGTRKSWIVLGIVRHLGNGGGFHAQIEFELHGMFEHFNRSDRPQPPGLRR